VIRNRSIDDCHQLTIADLLLSWFDEHARDLPWRKDISATLRSFYSDRVSAFVDCLPFAERLNPRRDPYAVIVSELMSATDASERGHCLLRAIHGTLSDY